MYRRRHAAIEKGSDLVFEHDVEVIGHRVLGHESSDLHLAAGRRNWDQTSHGSTAFGNDDFLAAPYALDQAR